ncbi:MAG: translocation/assembly module TamB [Treponema sp.]|nr:translocation/assembly module TamB [Treponema sp.]
MCLGVLLLLPVQQGLSVGMLSIRNGLIANLETFIGRKIRYSSISPSIFGAFDIRNMRILGEDSQPVVSVSRLRISYSFFELIQGKIGAIRSIRLDSPYIDFDMERDHDLLDLLHSFKLNQLDSRRSLAALIPQKFAVRVSSGQCLIQDGKDQYHVQDFNLDALIADNQIELDGGLDTVFSLNRIQAEPFSALIGIRVNGSGTADMENGRAVITIPAITGNLMEMRSLAFDLNIQSGILSLKKQSDPLPFDFSIDYNSQSGQTNARFNCANFMLRELFSFSGDWNAGNRWLDIAGTGMAFFDREQDEKISYRIDLAGAVPLGDASFEIHAGGDEKTAAIDSFRFTLPPSSEGAGFLQGEIDFHGKIGMEPFAPNGMLSLVNMSLTGTEGISAEFSISTREAGIRVFSDTVRLGGSAELKSLSVSLNPNDRDLDFSVSTHSAMQHGSFSLDGSLKGSGRSAGQSAWQLAQQIEANLLLDSFSPADITAMLRPFFREAFLPAPLERILHDTSINTELFVAADSDHIHYNVPRFEMVYAGGGRYMTGQLSMSGTDKNFELSEGRFMADKTADEEILLVSAQAEFADSRNINFSLNAAYRELSYHFTGRALDRHDISIEGAYGLRVHLAASNTGAYSGTAQIQEIPIPWRGSPAYLSFLASVHYTSLDSWSLSLDKLELTDIASPAGPALLRISGRADQNGMQLPLYYNDTIGPLNGSADLSWAADFSGFSGTLAMEGNREQYRITAALVEQQFDLLLSGSRMRLDRIIDGLNSTSASGDIRLSHDLSDSLRAEFNITSLRTRIFNRDLRASAQGLADNQGFTVQDMRVSFAELEGIIPVLTVNYHEGLAETRAIIQGVAGRQRLESSLALNAGFSPLGSWSEIGKALNSLNGIVHVENIRYGNAAYPEPFAINFFRNDGALLVLGGPQEMIRLQMEQDGNFYAGLSSPFPVRGSLIGNISQKNIDARCNDLYVDLAELWKFVPPEVEVVFAGGYANASLDIRGSFSDPEFFGWVRASSVRMQVPRFVTRDIRPIPFTAAIEGNEIRFGPVPATAGNGAATVSAWFQIDRWIPNIFSIDIQVPRETPVPVSFDITNFMARGEASGQLNLSMENVILSVKGDLLANNTEISMNTDENMPTQTWDGNNEDGAIPVIVNLNISTGSSVDFYWPNINWPIIRATPDQGTRVRVTANSQTGQYSVNSDIRIRSGEIFYFERNFFIRSGTLIFRESERRFDPLLTARAEARERTDQGPVTISMIVENAPLLSFTPRFESSPILSQMEIFTLLGQNIYGVPGEESFGNWQQALVLGTDILAQFLAVRQAERLIRNFMRLDMFSFRTRVLQNALFNATGLWQTPVDRPAGVGNYFDNTTVFLGKYVGQDMFVQSMLSMRHDANQMDFGGLRLEPDFGIELQSPLFSIRWDFNPTHPENWYFSDNSITLSKSWTF